MDFLQQYLFSLRNVQRLVRGQPCEPCVAKSWLFSADFHFSPKLYWMIKGITLTLCHSQLHWKPSVGYLGQFAHFFSLSYDGGHTVLYSNVLYCTEQLPFIIDITIFIIHKNIKRKYPGVTLSSWKYIQEVAKKSSSLNVYIALVSIRYPVQTPPTSTSLVTRGFSSSLLWEWNGDCQSFRCF